MSTFSLFIVLSTLAACAVTGGPPDASRPVDAAAPKTAPAATWDFNATIIEACSCPMFCQCYFNSRPAGPGCCSKADDPELQKRFCRFNNAFKVNRGTYEGTKLDGAKFWVAGDLGADFSAGQMQWCVLHFDPSVSEPQREGIKTIMGSVYPVKWDSFQLGKDMPVDWKFTKDRAEAKLDGGKGAEVILKRNQGMTDDPIVIKNLKYLGVPRNDGFVLMANEVETYKTGNKPYEFKGTNGFMITIDINSKDGAGQKKGY